MGQTPFSHPKVNLLTFFQNGFGVEKWVNNHGSQNNVAIQTTYIHYVCVLEFLEGEWVEDAQTPVEWNKHKNLPRQMDVNQSTIKNHLTHTWYKVTI
jgi:hypothetical protein